MEKSIKPKSLKEHYESTKEHDPLILAQISGKSIGYVKNFLKKAQGLSYTTGHKTNKKLHVPCGSKEPGHYQADCMFMHDYKSKNRQFIGILTCLNTTSRKAYARAFKNTEAATITKLLKEIIDETNKTDEMKNLRTDNGPEFANEKMAEMLEGLRIQHETAEPNTSAWLNRTNRFHRTLRGIFRDMFAKNKNNKWVDELPKIISDYNKTPSRAFVDSLHKSKPPNEINEKDKNEINEFEQKTAAKVGVHDDKAFNVGDYVRLKSQFTKKNKKDKFIKDSMDNVFTPEIYKIIARNGPNTWKIDAKNEITIWQTYNLMKASEAEYKTQESAKELATKSKPVDKFINKESVKMKRQMELEIPKEDKARQIGDLNVRTTRQSKPRTRSKTAKPAEPAKAAEEEFTVAKLLDSKLIRRKPHILVSWKGYDESHNTWEPRDQLFADIPEMVLKFESKK